MEKTAETVRPTNTLRKRKMLQRQKEQLASLTLNLVKNG